MRHEVAPAALSRFFAELIARRWWVIACYALLLPPSVYYAAKVGRTTRSTG